MPARRGVEGELADRDGHAAGALVAQAQDPLVVGHDDEPDVARTALAEEIRDPVDVVGRDPDAAGPPDDVAELLARAARRSACRRPAGTPRGGRPGPGRTGSRCGPAARPGRCTARGGRSCAGGARARGRPAPRWSGRASGRRPRRPKTSRSSGEKARSLVMSRLPSSAGPAIPMVVGRPAAMSSNGAGRGRITMRIAVGRDACRDGAGTGDATRQPGCSMRPRAPNTPQTPSDGARDRASPASGAVRSTRRS